MPTAARAWMRLKVWSMCWLKRSIKGGRPFLGICVGMQLMATRGLEKTVTQGLGWVEGDVVLMKPRDTALKIPQIGWNTLDLKCDHPCCRALKPAKKGCTPISFHSYHLECKDPVQCIATTDYGGPVTAVIGRDNMIGTQFHPEKSQRLGLD